jgi:hypoxanthine phosphoribosyltransferase
MDKNCALYGDLKTVIFTKDEIQKVVERLGAELTRDYKGKAPVMICILKGAAMFFCDLIRYVDLPLRTEYMILSSYQDGTTSSGKVRIVKDLDRNVAGEDVIIVEDIVDTGLTLDTLKKTLELRNAASVKIVTLLDKPCNRKVDLKPDYYGFDMPDAFAVGYGLDYAEKYRNLPEIGELDSKIYMK